MRKIIYQGHLNSEALIMQLSLSISHVEKVERKKHETTQFIKTDLKASINTTFQIYVNSGAKNEKPVLFA